MIKIKLLNKREHLLMSYFILLVKYLQFGFHVSKILRVKLIYNKIHQSTSLKIVLVNDVDISVRGSSKILQYV